MINFMRNSLVPFVILLEPSQLSLFQNFSVNFSSMELSSDIRLEMRVLVWLVIFFELNFQSLGENTLLGDESQFDYSLMQQKCVEVLENFSKRINLKECFFPSLQEVDFYNETKGCNYLQVFSNLQVDLDSFRHA